MGWSRQSLAIALVALVAAALSAPTPAAAARPPANEVDGVAALAAVIPAEYATAAPAHEAEGAARVRTMAAALRGQLTEWDRGGVSVPAPADAAAVELVRMLAGTREELAPWVPPLRVTAQGERLERSLRGAGLLGRVGAAPYDEIEALLERTQAGPARRDPTAAGTAAAEAYALFAAGPTPRLRGTNPALATVVDEAFWTKGPREPGLLASLAAGDAGAIEAARGAVEDEIDTAAVALGDHGASKTTVVIDAAVIVFREGLEAVLIVAAITASFVGERRRLRRPVLFGALLGLGASAVTYLLAQAIVDALGDGGLRLQAITGLLAIAVLLVVTNWFFHRVYWSEWIGRFNRRRKSLERLDRVGFISGQAFGLIILGLTSVYREGFETVLFLQNLQVSAGTGATLLGIAFGLGATFVVGFVTFRLERKLPYKKMLIATGVLIGLVLAVMVGTTVHNLQGLGWVPSTPTGFNLELWWGQWLGAYPTWEGIGAQVAAMLVVFGSYFVARAVQSRRLRVAQVPAASSPV
ncbi:MAG TPA: FTR1 family protein [Solirubrobacterales bacterium]|nr:FTR1 family protein [Solirubrobacterales bacterium]